MKNQLRIAKAVNRLTSLLFLFFLSGCRLFEPRGPVETPTGSHKIFKTPSTLENHFIAAFREREIIKYKETLHDNFYFICEQQLAGEKLFIKSKDEELTEKIFTNRHIFQDTLNENKDNPLILNFENGFDTEPEIDTVKYNNAVYTLTSEGSKEIVKGRAEIILKRVGNSWKLKEWRDSPYFDDKTTYTTLGYLKKFMGFR
ncbi:MAG: hypothetical protein ABIA63_06750 [bacterium]